MLYDRDIRDPLFDFMDKQFDKMRFLEEVPIGRSRADVLMVTETELYGLEIKSDADSYARLSRQIRDYDRFFDRNDIAVGTKHALQVEKHIPAWWGILTIDEVCTESGDDPRVYADFYRLREAEPNPKADIRAKLELLWRPELLHIQTAYKLPKYRNKSKAYIRDLLAERIPAETLSRAICEELLEREYQR